MGIRNNCAGLTACAFLVVCLYLGFALIKENASSAVGGTSQVEKLHPLRSLAGTTPTTASFKLDDPKKIYVPGIEFVAKKPDFGGEACIAMYLRSLGHQVDQDFVFDCSNLDPILGRGCHTKELVSAARRIGFEAGKVWIPLKLDATLAAVWDNLLLDLKNKIPSVVCRVHDNAEQFVLVIGYDPKLDKVIFHNPNVANGENEKADRVAFLRSCQLKQAVAENQPSSADRLQKSFVRIRLASNRLNVDVPRNRFTNADFAQHIRKLKARLPNDEFRIVLQKPFVVVGDGGLAQVKRSATATVKWAVDSIKKDYFSKDPEHIIDIWLFKNAESYMNHNKILFDTVPGTPFGYYSPANRALVMDISTGGGTLVHEIVHPFIESNFSDCPSWFNEGLASLYEQSSSRRGHIVGLTNWRLRGLQLAIQDDRTPSFKELCSTTRREFYDGKSTNYAQARYLCYYLQEHDLLIKFFHEFRANVDDDPTGYETLMKVRGKKDMVKFQKKWEAYVLKLRF